MQYTEESLFLNETIHEIDAAIGKYRLFMGDCGYDKEQDKSRVYYKLSDENGIIFEGSDFFVPAHKDDPTDKESAVSLINLLCSKNPEEQYNERQEAFFPYESEYLDLEASVWEQDLEETD